ncbi:MAG: methylated-DNA-[protein]-cysteine S-methyltransferase [Bacteriovoracaceae bacterium]|jgi:methylated-DNA-[protein]-cysteine S-methyltransferase
MDNTFVRQLITPIGALKIEANDSALLKIEFKKTKRNDESKVLDLASKELELYFLGKLKKFTVPIKMFGTDFQIKCWKELKKIKYGKTISYKEEAIKLGGPNYARAVAGANNKNHLPIIVPCHRVIGSNGSLVGYAGGLKIKEMLLSLEGEGVF